MSNVPKPGFVLVPNTPEERTRAGRYALGMQAADAEEGKELLDALGLDPADCRRPTEEGTHITLLVLDRVQEAS